jgi:hypothetical protein
MLAVIAAVFNMNAVDAVYFAGTDNGWSKTSTPFTKTGDNTWKISLSSLTGEFKIIETTNGENKWVGRNDEGATITFNTTYQGWLPNEKLNANIKVGDDISNKSGIIITYNSSNQRMTISYLECIYIVGNLSTGNWDTSTAVELTRTKFTDDSDKYTDYYYEGAVTFSPIKKSSSDAEAVAEEDEEETSTDNIAYFSFITFLGSSSDDWNVGTRYCPTTNTEVSSESGSVKYFDLATYSSGDQKAYYLSDIDEHSSYRIGVNLKTMQLLVGQGVATGVADVEVSDDALVNVYNFSGVAVRQGVKASEATLGLPNGLYIVGGKKVIVK